VPLLSTDDPLPHRPSRVAINGTSGSGKTTLARRIEQMMHLPHTEVDSLFHGPGWTPSPDFLDHVDQLTARPRWVCEYQYDAARPLMADRADLVVWLDLPVPLVMWRVVRRTVARRLRDQELWNGNREGPLREFFSDREHVIRHAWASRQGAEERALGLLVSHPTLPVVRLRSRREVERWLTGPLVDAQ
jgi:adenylate kinase family enzyme